MDGKGCIIKILTYLMIFRLVYKIFVNTSHTLTNAILDAEKEAA